MTALADRVAELLAARGVDVDRPADDDSVVHMLGGDDDDGVWSLAFLCLDQPHRTVVAFGIPPIDCPADRVGDLASLVLEANVGLMLGCFELDTSDGDLRARAGLRLGDEQLTDALLAELVDEVSGLVGEYGPKMLELMGIDD